MRWKQLLFLVFLIPLCSAQAAPETIMGTWTTNSLHVVLPGPGVIVAQPGNTATDFFSTAPGPWEADIPKYGDHATADEIASLVNGRYYELIPFGYPVVIVRIERPLFYAYFPIGGNK